MTDRTRIVPEESPRTYFTMIPNLVDDLNFLTPFAYRLYAHLRRVAGENGACWQNTNTLASSCNMSAGSVSKAKRELAAADLIHIEKKSGPNGLYDYITILNIWQLNHDHFTDSQNEQPTPPRSPHERPRSPGERPRSPGETKKNSLRKSLEEEDERAPRAPASWFSTLAKTCAIDLAVATEPQKRQVQQSAQMLSSSPGAALSDLSQFRDWWSKHDWRGKKGDIPTPAQVRAEWGKFREYLRRNSSSVPPGLDLRSQI